MRVCDAEFVCAGRRISAEIMLSSQFFFPSACLKPTLLIYGLVLCSCAQFVDIIGHQGLNRLIVRQERKREREKIGLE